MKFLISNLDVNIKNDFNFYGKCGIDLTMLLHFTENRHTNEMLPQAKLCMKSYRPTVSTLPSVSLPLDDRYLTQVVL